MGTIKAKIITVAFLTLPLSGCIYGPGFHGTNVLNQGVYNGGMTASLLIFSDFPGEITPLQYSVGVARGIGRDWDLGADIGGGDLDNFISFTFRGRNALTPSSIAFVRVGYFGVYPWRLFSEEHRNWYMSCEISKVKLTGKNFYWGYGGGLALGPTIADAGPEGTGPPLCPYPEIFFGYQCKNFLTVELEATPWPKVGIIITRGRY